MKQGEPVPEEQIFHTETVYGFETRQPLVMVLIGKTTMQVSPDDARAMGEQLIATAFASEADAFLVDFFEQELGLPLDKAVGLLAEFRKWRQERQD